MNSTPTIGLDASLPVENKGRVTHYGDPAPTKQHTEHFPRGEGSTQLQPREAAQIGHAKRPPCTSAKPAFEGYSLRKLARNGDPAPRWDRALHRRDLHAVAGFLRRIGGTQ